MYLPSGDHLGESLGPSGRLGIVVSLPVLMFKRSNSVFSGAMRAFLERLVAMTNCLASGAKSKVNMPRLSLA